MLMNAIPVSFEGKAYVHVGFGKTIDDGPRIHIFLWGSGISFDIKMAKNPKVFAEALEPPYSGIQSWSCAPGWFVEQISGDKVRVGIGGIVMTLSPDECMIFAHDIRMHLRGDMMHDHEWRVINVCHIDGQPRYVYGCMSCPVISFGRIAKTPGWVNTTLDDFSEAIR